MRRRQSAQLEAPFTRKRDNTHVGYKAHLAVDEESGLVRQAEMTPANVHGSCLGEALIQGRVRGFGWEGASTHSVAGRAGETYLRGNSAACLRRPFFCFFAPLHRAAPQPSPPNPRPTHT